MYGGKGNGDASCGRLPFAHGGLIIFHNVILTKTHVFALLILAKDKPNLNGPREEKRGTGL
jgi:hypothetical protein